MHPHESSDNAQDVSCVLSVTVDFRLKPMEVVSNNVAAPGAVIAYTLGCTKTKTTQVLLSNASK